MNQLIKKKMEPDWGGIWLRYTREKRVNSRFVGVGGGGGGGGLGGGGGGGGGGFWGGGGGGGMRKKRKSIKKENKKKRHQKKSVRPSQTTLKPQQNTPQERTRPPIGNKIKTKSPFKRSLKRILLLHFSRKANCTHFLSSDSKQWHCVMRKQQPRPITKSVKVGNRGRYSKGGEKSTDDAGWELSKAKRGNLSGNGGKRGRGG